MSTTTMGLYVLLGVLLLPIYVILLGWFTNGPRDYRTAFIGLGYWAVIAVVIIASTAVMAFVFGIITSL